MTPLNIVPGALTLAQLRLIANGVKLTLDATSKEKVDASQKAVADIIATERTVYGINTGFGRLAKTTIPTEKLAELQRNLVMSHATGVGAPLSDRIVRLIMALKIGGLARGHSGIRWEILQSLLKMLNEGLYPIIPAKGSVGASGDLAPLAHMSCALLGIGDVRLKGSVMPALEALVKIGLEPIILGPKEGLALLNGTQVSTALAIEGLFGAENNFAAAMIAGALSVDAAMGSDAPFDQRIHEVRGHQGQKDVATVYRNLLKGSEIRNSHLNCDRVQDPYSLRCQPQVMGACLDNLLFTSNTIEIEANAVSDNPLVFLDNGDVISGGNFHAEPVGLASDVLAIALSEVGGMSERRISLLMDSAMSGLPAFLVENGGLNSGFMIAQVTAAALASENKTLAHPASVDSLPTSANQEDHVSMATFAGRKLCEVSDNVSGIIAVELLASAQGIDFHAPMKTSTVLLKAMKLIRDKVQHYDKDRYFAPDLEAIIELIRQGEFLEFVPNSLLPSQ